jgi:hypothetical protein
MEHYSGLIDEIVNKNDIEASKDNSNILTCSKILKHGVKLEKYHIDSDILAKRYSKEKGLYTIITLGDILFADKNVTNYYLKVIENELKEVERTEEESEGLMALSANCVRGVDGLWRCVCPSETTAYGAGDLSCKTFINRPLFMCIKHNVDIPIQSLIGLVESNNVQVIKNENCYDE